MPILDGYHATRQLRELGYDTPIIALTGNAMQGDREKCIEAGCDDFLLKPFALKDLLQTLGKFLGFSDGCIDDLVRSNAEQETDDSLEQQLIIGGTQLSSDSSNGTRVLEEDPHSWTSSLANEAPEIQAILSDFVDDLSSKLELMEMAIEAEDFDTIESLAHWLKGSGGSLGFDRFTEPATALESAAEASRLDDCRLQWRSLVELNASIDLGMSPPTQSAPFDGR